MPLDTVVESIREAGKAEAERILAEARAERERMLSEVRAEAEKEKTDADARARQDAERRRVQALARAELEARKIVLGAQREALDGAFAGTIECAGGVVIESADGTRRIDLRYESILRDVWDDAVKEVADTLWPPEQ